MSQVSINGIAGMTFRLSIPRVGVWLADIDVPVQYSAGGTATCSGLPVPKQFDSATIVIDGNTLKGAVIVSDTSVYAEASVRVIGGNGALGTIIAAQNFGNGCTSQAVLSQLLSTYGEPAIDTANSVASFLSFYLLSFQCFGNRTLSQNVMRLANSVGCAWRLNLGTGAIQFLLDSYSASTAIPTNAIVIDDGHDGDVTFEAPFLDALPLPGTTGPNGRQVQEVIVNVIGEKLTFTLCPVQTSFVLSQPTSFELYGTYSAQVTGQSGNLLQLTFDDPRVAGAGGSQSVPFFPGAGITLGTVATNTRVKVCFDNGNPAAPSIIAWDGTLPSTIQLNAQGTVTLSTGNDFAALATKTDAQFQAIFTTLASLSGEAAFGTAYPKPTSVAASNVKIS